MSVRSFPAMKRSGAVLLAALLQLMSSAAQPVRAASLEYELKAAFLLNFARYIEWPNKTGELNICVIGPDVFGNALNEVAAGKTVNGRKIGVRKNVSAAEARTCELLYVSLRESAQVRNALKAVESSTAVTVGEDREFLRMGGTLAFAPQDDKIRFYINAGAVEHAGVKISSRLLVLGRNRHDDGERRR